MLKTLAEQLIDFISGRPTKPVKPAPMFRKDRKVHFEVEGDRCIIISLCGTEAFELQTHANPKYVTCKKCLRILNK